MQQQTVRYDRQRLYEEVWAEPVLRVAERYGVTDRALAKTCHKLNVPVPPLGYWRKKECGKHVERPPLPPLKEGQPPEIVVQKPSDLPVDDPQVQAAIDFERKEANRIRVPAKLADPHPHVVRQLRHIELSRDSRRERRDIQKDDCLDIRVTSASWDRALRIMDTLIKALEAHGYPVTAEYRHFRSVTSVEIMGDTFPFDIYERTRLTRPTADGTAPPVGRHERRYGLWRTDMIPTGRLTLRAELRFPRTCQVGDGQEQKLEDRLNAFIISLLKEVGRRREEWRRREPERQRAREQERLRQEQERQRQERLQLQQQERASVEDLFREAEAWHRAKRIREYLEAVRRLVIEQDGQVNPGSQMDQWLTWASLQADRLDPLTESPPSILDETI